MAKYEIHVSELRTFLQCRRKFQWSSLLHRGLEPARPVRHLYLGSGVHYALQQYYDKKETCASAFSSWAGMQSSTIRKDLGMMWDDEVAQILAEEYTLGMGMLNHYDQWAPSAKEKYADRRLKFLATEISFNLPMPSPSGRPSSRIRLAGRFDGLVQHKDTGLFWLFETKTTRDLRDLSWVGNDIQAGVYIWAAQQMFDVPIQGVLYNFLLKKAPRIPRPLKRGGYSIAKNELAATTFELLLEQLSDDAANAAGIDFIPAVGYNITKEEFEKLPTDVGNFFLQRRGYIKQYREQLQFLKDRGNTFFRREEFRRTQRELKVLMAEVHHIGLEMVRPSTWMYANPGFFTCNMCSFQDPCRLKNAGGQFKIVLEYEYRPRQTWRYDVASRITEWKAQQEEESE